MKSLMKEDFILNLKVKIKTLKDNLIYTDNQIERLKENKEEIKRLINKYEKDIEFEMNNLTE